MAVELRNADLLRDVRTLFGFGVVRDASDRELLERFLHAEQAEAEQAFTFLVERHGPMILSVCRHVLNDSHDVQDAFQATFLVLLRRAESIRNRDSLASWLFGVAMRVARQARHAAVARRFHEQHAGDRTSERSLAANGHSECLTAMHEEIARLPARYREPIVLCHLEGLSTAAAARQLGCAQGTILSRLARGRQRLRTRLNRRGQDEPVGVLAAAVPASIVHSTVQTALNALAVRISFAAIVAPSVTALTRVTVRTLLMPRIALVAALLTTTCVMTAVTIPLVGPFLQARSQVSSIDNRPQPDQVASQTKDQNPVLPRDLEEAFYKILDRDLEFNDPDWPFAIKVRYVVGKSLVDATFKHRAKGKLNEFDAIIQSKRAVLRFDLDAKVIRIFLEQSKVQHFVRDSDLILIDNDILEIPVPSDNLVMVLQNLRCLAGGIPERRAESLERDQPLSLAYSSDGKTLVWAGFDGVAHLWDVVEAKEVGRLEGKKSAIRSASFSPDGKTLACVGDEGLVRLWDLPTRALKKSWSGLSDALRKAVPSVNLDAVVFAPDGQSLAVAGGAGKNPDVPEAIYEVRILEAQTGRSMWSRMGREERLFSLAFAPDGRFLAGAGGSDVELWNARTGEPVRFLDPAPGKVFAVAFTPDAKSLIGAGDSSQEIKQPAGGVNFWEVATGKLRRYESGAGRLQSVAVAPDGKTIAGGIGPWRDFPNQTWRDFMDPKKRVSGEIRLWDTATGKLLWMVDGVLGSVRCLVFAPNGKTLSFCDDRVVGVIDVATGKTVRILVRSTLESLH